jgi:hypothetical protein
LISGQIAIARDCQQLFKGGLQEPATYVLGHVLENARLQGHLHVDSACDPAQLSLADVQYPIDLFHGLAADDGAVPCLGRNGLDGRLDLGQTEVVDVGILLLVGAVVFEGECVQGVILGRCPLDGCCLDISVRGSARQDWDTMLGLTQASGAGQRRRRG